MKPTRRDLSLLLPALLATADAHAEVPALPVLPSKCYEFDELPVKKDPKTGNESRQVFHGATHTGCPIDLHISVLNPGMMPHPPHHHAHEETMFIREGTLEFTIDGKVSRIGPGSVAYVASNEEHGLKNVGEVPARYFVLALGDMKG
jgi:mannose-6-phosphate isomerase-like protein (cupin superfamily)